MNIMFDSNCNVKLIDFGDAKTFNAENPDADDEDEDCDCNLRVSSLRQQRYKNSEVNKNGSSNQLSQSQHVKGDDNLQFATQDDEDDQEKYK